MGKSEHPAQPETPESHRSPDRQIKLVEINGRKVYASIDPRYPNLVWVEDAPDGSETEAPGPVIITGVHGQGSAEGSAPVSPPPSEEAESRPAREPHPLTAADELLLKMSKIRWPVSG